MKACSLYQRLQRLRDRVQKEEELDAINYDARNADKGEGGGDDPATPPVTRGMSAAMALAGLSNLPLYVD